MKLADSVIIAVAGHYGLDADDIRGKSRSRSLVHARFVAMYLLVRRSDMSLKEIGAEFNGRSHTSVMHARDELEEKMEIYPDLAADLEQVMERIQPAPWSSQAVVTPGAYAAARDRAASFASAA